MPNLKSICENITTLHGTTQLTRKKGRGLILWSCILVLIVGVMTAYVFVISKRYSNDQIITRINANCKVNEVPFPSVSICNFNVVSLKQTESITKILQTHNRTREEIEYFYQSLPLLIHFKNITAETNVSFNEIINILNSHYFTIETIMEEVHQKCEDLLLYCTFNSKVKKCSEMFTLIKTYEGYCCAFNYAALNEASMEEFVKDDDFEYYVDPSDEDESARGILVTSDSGRGSGLSVLFNLEPKDYANFTSIPYYGAKILIYDPDDYPEITVLYHYAVIGESQDIKVAPKIFQSEEDIRTVAIDKRGCIFHDEIALTHTNRYSTEICLTECKMRTYAKYCGCIPYQYPREKESRICAFEDLECLNRIRAHKINGTFWCKPECYIECRDQKYSITTNDMPLLAHLYPRNVTNERNLSELAALQVYYAKSTCNCYKKMLLIDFNYFIATYGGIFSLSFGASIITVYEIIYLLLSYMMRLFSKSIENKRNKVFTFSQETWTYNYNDYVFVVVLSMVFVYMTSIIETCIVLFL